MRKLHLPVLFIVLACFACPGCGSSEQTPEENMPDDTGVDATSEAGVDADVALPPHDAKGPPPRDGSDPLDVPIVQDAEGDAPAPVDAQDTDDIAVDEPDVDGDVLDEPDVDGDVLDAADAEDSSDAAVDVLPDVGACESNDDCVEGLCCEGLCVDTEIDAGNCGACGVTCEVFCDDGACAHAVALDAGWSHACAVLNNGSVWCWGSDYPLVHSLPLIRVWPPVKLPGVEAAIDVSASHDHTCVVHSSGQVSCFGHNDSGQLCQLPQVQESRLPLLIPGISDAIDVAVAEDMTCIRNAVGETRCCGGNHLGRFGDPAVDNVYQPTLVGLPSLQTMEYSGQHGLWIDREDSMWTSGSSLAVPGWWEDGQRGIAERFSEPTDIVDVDVGEGHSCAATTAGEVYCWGQNNRWQVTSLNNRNPAWPPSRVPVENAIAVGLGAQFSCTVTRDGSVYCWGACTYAEVCDEEDNFRIAMPARIPLPETATSTVAGKHPDRSQSIFACSLARSGQVYCWGSCGSGECGRSETPFDIPPGAPVQWREGLR